MAHFARLNSDNIVEQVIVVANKDTSDDNGVEDEIIGIGFCKKLFGSNTNWKQTSYNGNFRVRYAGRGYSYDPTLDAFIPPKPFESWVIDSDTVNWKAPLEEPTLTQEQIDAGSYYRWDEDAHQADNTTGWVLETETPE
jgi:hypothetical protein